MNIEIFNRRLIELVESCGGRVTGSPEITLGAPWDESFLPVDPAHKGIDGLKAVRTVTPLRMNITISFEDLSAWRHNSGDNRRLSPDLRSDGVAM